MMNIFPDRGIIGFHLRRPHPSRDYDPDEENRIMLDVNLILGPYMLTGKIRTSTHADIVTNLEAAHMTWLSVYFAEIVNPFLSQLPAIHVSMLLVKPTQVSFGI
jgi:hypothetical protein